MPTPHSASPVCCGNVTFRDLSRHGISWIDRHNRVKLIMITNYPVGSSLQRVRHAQQLRCTPACIRRHLTEGAAQQDVQNAHGQPHQPPDFLPNGALPLNIRSETQRLGHVLPLDARPSGQPARHRQLSLKNNNQTGSRTETNTYGHKERRRGVVSVNMTECQSEDSYQTSVLLEFLRQMLCIEHDERSAVLVNLPSHVIVDSRCTSSLIRPTYSLRTSQACCTHEGPGMPPPPHACSSSSCALMLTTHGWFNTITTPRRRVGEKKRDTVSGPGSS